MRNIQEALQQHLQVVLNAGFEEKQILGIFLYGSQNYGLATENSDVDTKVILIPTLEDLCAKKAGFVKEYRYNDEKVVVMDLIHYIDNLKKQNINYVETLFTDYYWVNPDNQWIWSNLLMMKEYVAYYDVNKAIQSMGRQALHTLGQDSGNSKKYAMAKYISHFLRAYVQPEGERPPYKEALSPLPHITETLVAIKTGKVDYTVYDVLELRQHLRRVVNMEPFPINLELKEKIDNELFKILIAAVRHLDNL